MLTLPRDKLDKVLQRHDLVTAQLNSGAEPATFVKLSRELAELTPFADAIRDLDVVEAEARDLKALASDATADAEMDEMDEMDEMEETSRTEWGAPCIPTSTRDSRLGIATRFLLRAQQVSCGCG